MTKLLFHAAWFILFSSVPVYSFGFEDVKSSGPVLVEQTRFDWNHSGSLTTFSLFRDAKSEINEPDELVIKQSGKPRWTLKNKDDVWAPLSETGMPAFRKQTKRLFFVASSSQPNAQIYLILKGADSGWIGSMTILISGEDGQPKIVFHEAMYLLTAVTPVDGGFLKIIGKSSDSEARAIRNAESYDPYRIYLLQNDQVAKYDPDLSKQYTESHYCEWHGPEYDERFVAVGVPKDSVHCRVMSEKGFALYRQKHPELFPEQ